MSEDMKRPRTGSSSVTAPARFFFSFSFVVVVLVVFFSLSGSVESVISPDDCSQDVNIPTLSFPVSSLSCKAVWPRFNFILRYHYDESIERLTIVLSASIAMNWFAMGWSPTGYMVGASAMVGYMSIDGNGIIHQYYLAGRTSSEVIRDAGNLTLVPGSQLVVMQNQTIYMGFQIYLDSSSASSSNLIYAYAHQGQTPDENGYIALVHQGSFQMELDFTTGSTTSVTSPVEKLRKSHGIVNIFAWAILASAGGFIARYLRQRAPLWYYLHLGLQTSSFLLAIVGVGLGIKLTHELPDVSWGRHRLIGIFVFLLATLQVTAICWRPGKDSSIRRFWNWFHATLGRFILLLAAINIVVGIRLADAGYSWKAAYATILAITLVSFLILESIYWFKWFKQRRNPSANFSSYEMM